MPYHDQLSIVASGIVRDTVTRIAGLYIKAPPTTSFAGIN